VEGSRPPFPDGSSEFVDRRDEFAASPADRDSERRFIESRIALIASDPRLSDADKERAIAPLQAALEDSSEAPDSPA